MRRQATCAFAVSLALLTLGAVGACGDVVVSGGDDAAAGADTGGAGPPGRCEAYCDQVLAACGDDGPTAQYASRFACLSYCDAWAGLPAGAAGDTGGNTIGCRTYHATVAGETDPGAHCVHAGPSGGDVCGTWCENYCHLALRNCTGEHRLYADEADCLATCAGFPAAAPHDAEEGDSVQCRIHALGLAGAEPPETAARHCPSGSPSGGDVCVDTPTCEAYCDLMENVCEAAGASPYEDDDECFRVCADELAFPPGATSDTDAHSIGCRMYHANVAAATMPEEHCLHAGPTGGDECGSWCDNYCHAALRNCTGEHTLFPDAEACFQACEPREDALGDAEQRRIFGCLISNLALAARDGLGNPDAQASYCPQAAIVGGGCN